MKLLGLIILPLLLAVSAAGANYYASPAGSGTACSLASPCSLAYGIGASSPVTSADTLYLRGGTYSGKFTSALMGGTVRSYTGEWAKIDGYVTTTLVGAMDASQTTFTVADGSVLLAYASPDVSIGTEVIRVLAKSGNNVTNSLRAASGTINGTATTHPDGALVIISGSQLEITGSNTTYRDFEVANSSPWRDGNTPELGRGNGIFVTGDDNKLINLVVHDNMNGVFTSSATSNTEIYGVISYNNGTMNVTGLPARGLGHGYYLENSAGFSKVYENISLNNFNNGLQGYGQTGPYVGGDIQGLIAANSGAPQGADDPAIRTRNLIVGTNLQQSVTASVTASHLFHPHDKNGYLCDIGFEAGIVTATVTNNYFVGGGTLMNISNITNATITGNTAYSRLVGAQYTLVPSGKSWTWNSNTYHDSGGRSPFGVNAVGLFSFANWKTQTGFDAASSETSIDMPDTVVVRPNSYETGRANIIIYAPSSPGSINVNLSTTGLTNGQGYTIRNAFDYLGAAVATGTYSAASPTISVSLSGAITNVAQPVGHTYTVTTTVPDFAVLVVVPNASSLTLRYFLTVPPTQ